MTDTDEWEKQYCTISNLTRVRSAVEVYRAVMGHPQHGVPDEILALEKSISGDLAILQEYYTAEVDKLSNPKEHEPNRYPWKEWLADRASTVVATDQPPGTGNPDAKDYR